MQRINNPAIRTSDPKYPAYGEIQNRTGASAPSTLFTTEQGLWLDPSDFSTMFQDTAGTLPASLGSRVNRINDKSGNGNHVLTIAGSGALLRAWKGVPFLDFDSSSLRMGVSFTVNQPMARISAIRQLTSVAQGYIFSGRTANLNALLQTNPLKPNWLSIYDVAAQIQTGELGLRRPGVVTEYYNGTSSQIAVNNGSYVVGNPGTTSGDGFMLGHDDATSITAAFWLFGVAQIARAMTTPEVAAMRTYFGAPVGLAL